MIGPDAGIVSCEVDGRWRCRLNLLDGWAYFWRLAVVLLLDDLPPGAHHAVLRLEPERPDASVLRRPPSGPHWEQFRREGKEHKLWLMHWLIEEEGWERLLVPFRGAADGGAHEPGRRLDGSSGVGGSSGASRRRAD